jgi:hypothetical protein
MGQQITGIHIFEKLGPIDWEDELIAIQALSALTWKKYHGRIELYCNEEHLESLKKWGVDKLYDKIDTESLKSAPTGVDRSEYWSFCKLFISYKLDPPFVLVDTDLWLTDSLTFDFNKSFVAYHEENYDWSRPYNFYVNFDNFIPEKYLNYFDLTVKPVNVALLFWNDKELLKSWLDITNEILSENRKCELDRTQKTTFLEQWLLPMNAVKTNKPYEVLIPQRYNSSNDGMFEPNLWSPDVSEWNDEHWFTFNKIKHIWGLKKHFNHEKISTEIFEKVRYYIDEFKINELGLNDLKSLINKTAKFTESKTVTGDSLNVLYCVPNIITNSLTNILIKRIENIYKEENNIIIYVCNLGGDRINNNKLKLRIINLIGNNNYFSTTNESLDSIIKDKNIDICQYDISDYDEEFNIFMEKKFNEKKTFFIKSYDGVNLISNSNDSHLIEYPIINNVNNLIDPNSDYKFDNKTLPLHVKYQYKILFGLDHLKKHIICIGDINNIPNKLINIISKSYNDNSNTEFHFLNYVDEDSKNGKVTISKLSESTKIWQENVDFYDFILIADTVIYFNDGYSSLIDEVESYGITVNNIKKITNINDNKINRITPTNNKNFGQDYSNYYLSVRNKQ